MTGSLLRVARQSLLMTSVLWLGCESAPTVNPGVTGRDSERTLQRGPAGTSSASAGDVRVHAVQRIEAADKDAVNAAVSIRNTGRSAETVTVVVAWVTADGASADPANVSRMTITLAPKEAREVVFEGAPGTRDFKLSLAYPGG